MDDPKKLNHLLLLAKYPQVGQVKTRLAQDVGNEAATEIYRELVEKIVDQCRSSDYQFHLHFSPKECEFDFKQWLPDLDRYEAQVAGDLGMKLIHGFESSFSQGAQKVLTIGGDCPEVDHNLILEAFQTLENNDIVIGPAYDGGYYLIGMKKMIPELFQNIQWSTSKVFDQTKTKIQALGLSLNFLRILSDIDTQEDWLKLNLLSQG